jgi:hypothetical protein
MSSRLSDSGHDRSLEECLTNLISACKVLDRGGRPGAPKKDRIAATVKKLMGIWSTFTRKRFPISLRRTEVKKPDRSDPALGLPDDDRKEVAFWSPAAQFVLTVMRGMDPARTDAEVAVGIRYASRPRSRSRPKVKKTTADLR